MNGLLLALEGPDGAGKTTVAGILLDRLLRRGAPAILTREVHTSPEGERVRRILRGEEPAPAPLALAGLYAADRLAHLADVVLPALRRGAIVITDRYVLSSIAYQHGALRVPLHAVRDLNRYAPAADLTVVLDAPADVCAERRRWRGRPELFDGEDVQARVRAVYADAGRYLPAGTVAHVSAEGGAEDVADRVWDAVARMPTRGWAPPAPRCPRPGRIREPGHAPAACWDVDGEDMRGAGGGA